MSKNKSFSLVFFILCSVCFLCGCVTTAGIKTVEKVEPLFYPPQPAEPRIQYLTSFSSSEDIEGKSGGFNKFIIGEDAPKKLIVKPYGVKVHKGKLYVCDTVYNSLEILDLNRKKFEYFRPTGVGQLIDPINLDLSEDGRLFVADARRGQVVIFDVDGKYNAVIGAKSEFKPTDVAIFGDNIFIADLKSHTVRVYKLSDYSFLYSIPKEGQPEGAKLFSPVNIDIDIQGNVYVSDAGAYRINKYDNAGLFLKAFGSQGDAPGQFARPKGVAVDKTGIIYAVDAAFENVQIFDAEGKILLYFPEPQDRASFVLPAGIYIDYENVKLFSQFIDKDFVVEYLIFVASQYGDRKVSVFGFGKKK